MYSINFLSAGRLALIFIFCFTYPLISQNKEITSKDKNYKFVLAENSPYHKMLFHSFVNEDADFVLVNSEDNIHFALVSDKRGKDQDISQDEFLDEVKDEFTFLSPGTRINKVVNSDVDRLTGHRIHLTKNESGTKFIYDVRAINHNGIYYQLITYTWESNGFKKLKEEADYLAQKFKILDKDYEYFSDDVQVISNYDSELAPFKLNFEGKKRWFHWDDFESDNPETEFGGNTINLNQRFSVSTLLYDSKAHTDELIANTFLREFNMKLSDEIFSVVKKIDGKPFRSYRLKATREAGGEDYDYYFEIYFADNVAFCVSLWGDANTQETNLAYKSLMQAIKFKENHKRKTDLNDSQKLTQRILNNGMGLVYYRQENYKEAADSFLKAFYFDKDYTQAATNYFWSMSKLSKIEEILQLIEKEPHILKDPDAMAWKAFCLKDTKRFKEALVAYEELFNLEGYDNEMDFADYASLLIDHDKIEKLQQTINKYLSIERSHNTYLKISNILIDYEYFDKASKVLKKMPEKFQNDLETKRHYLKFHIVSGNYKKADTLFEKLLKDGHRDRKTLYTGAKLYYDIGWYHKSKQTLSELIKISPNDEEAKELLDSTLGYLGEGNKGNTTEPIKAVKMPTILEEQSSKVSLPTKDGDVHYEYLIICYSHENGKLKKTVYKKFKLKTPTGVKNNSTFYYDYNPSSSSIYVNKLSVTDPAGKKTVHSDRNAFYLKDADDDLATEEKTLCMPVSSLQPGCTVEYVITQEYGAHYDDFPFKREWLCMTVPYEFLSVSVSGDVDPIYYKVKNSSLKPIKNKNELIFKAIDNVVYKSEARDAPAEYNYPLLILASKKLTWKKVISNYKKKIQKKLVPSKELEELVQKLTKDKTDQTAKVQSLISYIQKNISYQGIEFGTRGTIPDTPLKVINQKYGDCKDMAVLLHQMLKTLNIKSTLTLVSTDNKIDTKAPSLDQFNHMILYIDAMDKFVDCTVKNANLLTIGNTYMHGSKALLVNDNADFKEIPYYEVKSKAVSVKRNLTLLENDIIAVDESVIFRGYYAYFLRNSLLGTDQKDRSDKVKNWVNYFPEIEDFTVEILNLDNYMNNLQLKMKYKIKRAVKKLANDKILNLESPWVNFYLGFEKVEDRYNPVKFYYDFSLESEVKFNAANLAKIDSSSLNIKKKTSIFAGTVDSTIANGEFILNSSYSISKGTFPAKDYEPFYEASTDFTTKAAIHLKLLPITK